MEAREAGASTKRGLDHSGSRNWRGVAWPVLWAALVFYTSLLPFDVRFERAGTVWPSWAPASAADARTNLLVYVPLGGFIASFLSRWGGRKIFAMCAGTAVGSLMSLIVELLQTLLPSRVASWTDVVLDTAGAGVGAIGAVAVGVLVSAMVQSARWEWRERPFTLGSGMLVLGLFVYQIAPCDFVWNTSELHAAFARARFNPFSIPAIPASEALVEFAGELSAATWFLVLGGLLGLAGIEAGRRQVSALGSAIKQGVILATTIEMMQLFTQSHIAETNSIVMRTIALAMGAWSGVFLLGESPELRSGGRLPRAAWMPIVVALVFWQFTLLVLPGLNWFLGTTAASHGLRFGGLPFEQLWRAPGLAGPMQAASTILTYFTLAVSVRVLLAGLPTRSLWMWVAGVTLSAACLAEVIPAVLGIHAADVTTLLLALAAVVVAQNATHALMADRRVRTASL